MNEITVTLNTPYGEKSFGLKRAATAIHARELAMAIRNGAIDEEFANDNIVGIKMMEIPVYRTMMSDNTWSKFCKIISRLKIVVVHDSNGVNLGKDWYTHGNSRHCDGVVDYVAIRHATCWDDYATPTNAIYVRYGERPDDVEYGMLLHPIDLRTIEPI